MRLPSRWVTHQVLDEIGPVAAASGPAAALEFAAAMQAPSAMDRPISDRTRGLGRDTQRHLKGFIRDMVRICRYSPGPKDVRDGLCFISSEKMAHFRPNLG